MKRALVLGAGLLVLGGVFASAALAAQPNGPRLAFVEWRLKPERTLVASVGPDGGARRTVFERRSLEPGSGGMSWLSDGSRLAIAGTMRSLKPSRKGEPPSWIYLVDPETGHARRVLGTKGGRGPVISPDGSQIAFTRSVFRFHFNPKNLLGIRMYASASTWIVSRTGGGPRQVTPWRNGLSEMPSSFSPDSSVLALERSLPRKGPEVVAYHLDTERSTLIAREAEEPEFSPDGSRIALVSYRDGIAIEGVERDTPVSELYLVDPDGSNPVRLTRSANWHESEPSWDASGKRLAFIRSNPGVVFGPTSMVMEINADGTCSKAVVGKRFPGRLGPVLAPVRFSPTWQPGPGREAGPINC